MVWRQLGECREILHVRQSENGKSLTCLGFALTLWWHEVCAMRRRSHAQDLRKRKMPESLQVLLRGSVATAVIRGLAGLIAWVFLLWVARAMSNHHAS